MQQEGYALEKLQEAIRKEFPRADVDASGRRRAFFENGAGSLVLQRAADAEARARIDCSANVGGPSWESKKNEDVIAEGRQAVADFLNAPSPDCVFSGESATSMLFAISYALSKEMTGRENIVLTDYEHYANVSPWLELEQRGVVKEVRFARFNPADGQLDVSHFETLLDDKTRVVSISGVSNVMGSRTPTDKMLSLAKEVGAYTVFDAVHTVPHIPVDVQKLACDFAVFSGYKLFSRRGSFAYGRRELLEGLRPYKVLPSPNTGPEKWEMGTRDQSLFASITAVMEYFEWLGGEVEAEVRERISEYEGRKRLLKAAMAWIEQYEQTLSRAMLGGTGSASGIRDMKNVELYGSKDPSRPDLRVPTFTFNISNADAQQVAQYLWDKHSIALLAENGGGFYSRTLKTYAKTIGVRASLTHFNTIREVTQFLTGLQDATNYFNKM
jgi:cysteine desulfurase family protein (TIGR01976 family)